MSDCNFTSNDTWFRYRAGAIIVEDGCVLLAKNEESDYYYSVGGGVALNETSEEAVLREVFEETGVHYEIDRLAVVHENFFKGEGGTIDGMKCHVISFFYLMKPRGTKELHCDSYTHGVKEHMHWIPIDKLDNYRAYPVFLKEYLTGDKTGIRHYVTGKR